MRAGLKLIGAVAALGTGPAGSELEERLHALERKQFVRRQRHSSVAGQTEYAFAGRWMLLASRAHSPTTRTT